MRNNLKNLRIARGWSQKEAGERFGVSERYYGKIERGDRGLTEKWIDKAAEVFGVKPGQIIDEPTFRVAIIKGVLEGGDAIKAIVWEAGANREVPLDDLPEDTPPGLAVVLVRGDSYYPRFFDGDQVFYAENPPPIAEAIDQECVIGLPTGESIVRILRRGSRPDRFHLERWNAPTMFDQRIEWASPVLYIRKSKPNRNAGTK